MDTLNLSTKMLFVCALLLLLILVTGPLGYKFDLVPLRPSLYSLVIAAAGGGLVFLVSLGFLCVAIKNGLVLDRTWLIVTLVLAILPVVIMVPQIVTARTVPPIHDITTDTANPPEFIALHEIRVKSPNGADYGASENWPADKLMQKQAEAYPEIQPLMSDLSQAEALARSEQVLEGMGLELAPANGDAMQHETGATAHSKQVEATATTFWFGFKDDVIVRVTSAPGGSRVDLRSMSRLGQSDVGANAARIREFTRRFNAD